MEKINFKDFIDTTLREGAQSPLLFDTKKYFFSLEEKKQIIKGLIELGISYFEFFCPIVNQKEESDFLSIKNYIKSIAKRKIFLLAHCRVKKEDIKKSLELGFDGLNLFLRVSEYSKFIYRKSLKEILKFAKKEITNIKRKLPNFYIRFSIEDAFRTPFLQICKIFDIFYPFVDTFGIPDTTGVATPEMVRKFVKKMRKRYPKVNLECHFHNDRGLAIANSIEAIKAGIHYLDTSIWGLGERSGITSITAILFNLYCLNKNLTKKYKIEVCYPLNVMLGSILKMQVPFNEPVSLTNRTHIAGIHQQAVLKMSKTYEANPLKKFGVNKNQLLLGPLSGWHAIFYYLKEIGDFVVDENTAKLIAKEFKNEMTKSKKEKDPEKILEKLAKKYSLLKISIPKQQRERRIEDLS
jgi:homocitrate synthase